MPDIEELFKRWLCGRQGDSVKTGERADGAVLVVPNVFDGSGWRG
ncbi:MAG: hypothetical protein ACREDM_00420 [Methylocella sp.]